jgi:uncharacterized damage-inducible protein DinB
MELPVNPAGVYAPEDNCGPERCAALIEVIAAAPEALRQAVAGLSEEALDTLYRNWTIRQIVHHLADSHVNSYVRFKWTLTEESPTIKAYDEGRWVALDDSRTGNISTALALMDGLHVRWVQLLRSMTEEQFARVFIHPETGQAITLSRALGYYAWHCRHHMGQILWLRQNVLASRL